MSFSEQEFEVLNNYIANISGMSFKEIGQSVLTRRTLERMKALSIEDFQYYFTLIKENKTELTKLVDSITNNLSYFFRTSYQIHAFYEELLPFLVKKNQQSKKLRIWSAGCATGEEPYSISMLIDKYLGTEAPLWDIKILASDISLKSLIVAYDGIYHKKKFKHVDPAFINRYTNYIDGYYHIKKDIKKNIIFDFHNLINSNHYSGFDIIFCRNVIIYFELDMQKKVVNHFYDKLKNDSYLILGPSETLASYETSFSNKKIGDAILYYKE